MSIKNPIWCWSVKLTHCISRPPQVCQVFSFNLICGSGHPPRFFSDTWEYVSLSHTGPVFLPLRSWGQGAEAHPICCTSLGSRWQSTRISIMGPDSCYKKYLGLPTSMVQLGGSKPPFSTLTREEWMVKWRKEKADVSWEGCCRGVLKFNFFLSCKAVSHATGSNCISTVIWSSCKAFNKQISARSSSHEQT